MRPGLVSITFRALSPRTVVEVAREAGLEGIEWGGDVHVPHGETATARAVADLTREAGLEVSSYGSYYRAGEGEAEGLSLSAVIETASALGAPLLRIWAGRRGSADTDGDYRKAVADDLRRVAEAAADAGIAAACEYHGDTLTDTVASATRLMNEVDHANMGLYWQPPNGRAPEPCIESLEATLPYLACLHVFHWVERDGRRERCSLAEGEEVWPRYLARAAAAPGETWALIEFVRGDEPSQLMEDAAALRGWIAG